VEGKQILKAETKLVSAVAAKTGHTNKGGAKMPKI